jgi:hypothetical protein
MRGREREKDGYTNKRSHSNLEENNEWKRDIYLPCLYDSLRGFFN